MQLYFWYILYMLSSQTTSGDYTNNLALFFKSFRSLCSLCDPQLMIIFCIIILSPPSSFFGTDASNLTVNCQPYIPSSQSSFKTLASAIIPSALFNVCVRVFYRKTGALSIYQPSDKLAKLSHISPFSVNCSLFFPNTFIHR